MTVRLAVTGLRHRYGAHQVLDGIDLFVEPVEVLCLLGPSGSGKTTILRLIAGLEPVQEGTITIDGRLMGGPARHTPPERRGVGLVFQDAALFPHLTVAGNVGFGLRGGERRARIADLLERVGLAGFESRYPHTLSGGQQQRVALARALAPSPAVMLLDEPFAALDAIRREQVREEAIALLREAGVATVLVTHDAEEAMAVADRIALLDEGRILQTAPPRDLYELPRDRRAAAALGKVNVVLGEVADGRVRTALGCWPVALPAGPVDVLLRPEWLRVLPADGEPSWRVAAIRFQGPISYAWVTADRQPSLIVLAPPGLRLDQRVSVIADSTRAVVVPTRPRHVEALDFASR
ncbi:MAG: ABC transporter [Dehalococcoidia bacterium]|nr:MAG: ABC transporter [Dehalococcoidia bacterium]